MNYTLFLGCTITARCRNYEMATRRVAESLGLVMIDLPHFSCCGFPLKSADRRMALVMGARNLALAETQAATMCVLCSACNANLNEIKHELDADPALKEDVNRHLAKIGLNYQGTIRIKHFSRILYEDIGIQKIQEHVTQPLSALAFAPHYGCHYLKPSYLFEGFDEVENPRSLAALIEATGAKSADLGGRKNCCGGAVLAVEPAITYAMAKEKLKLVRNSGADGICLICPFCSVIYDDNQKSLSPSPESEFSIPVLYYPQILGFAMGIDAKELGLNLNRVKVAGIFHKLGKDQG